MRNRLYHVIADFVPILLGEPGVTLETVELHNSLAKGAILDAWWLKWPAFRKPTQRHAHLVLCCASIETANRLLKEGAIIEGKKSSTRKLIREPQRCLKCQLLSQDHMAASCPSIHDTCGMCAGLHKSHDCQVTDPARYRCAS
jgi:hypothetical protein